FSEVVKSAFGFHIIKVEERRTGKNEKGEEQPEIHARHILIRVAGGPQAPGSKSEPLREQAREAVKNDIVPDKIKSLIDETVKRSRVVVAQDFKIVAPEMPAPPPETPDTQATSPDQQSGAPGAGHNIPSPHAPSAPTTRPQNKKGQNRLR
ncbi:MAG: peptidylprolyl isomerase, partial [Pyrinomonadaceae bacterium]